MPIANQHFLSKIKFKEINYQYIVWLPLGKVIRMALASDSMSTGINPEWIKNSPVVVGLYVNVNGASLPISAVDFKEMNTSETE